MTELKDFVPKHDILQRSEYTLRSLSPEDITDRTWAHVSDLVTLEAHNPDDMSHDAMKPKALERFMAGDAHHMTRFLIVDPSDFFTNVDRKIFDAADFEARKAGNWKMAFALDKMRIDGVLGFVYMSDDEYKGGDHKYRAQTARDVIGLPADLPVWDLNTGFVPGTKDKPVKFAVQETLDEFVKKLQGRAAGVYVADAHDIKDAMSGVSLGAIAKNPDLLAKATAEYQDARVLTSLKFRMAGRMQYEPGKGWKDFLFAIMLRGTTK